MENSKKRHDGLKVITTEKIEFSHREEHSKPIGTILRPVAKVSLQHSNQEWTSEFMYIDSGADFTLIPYKLGKFLGLRHENEEVYEIQGINGVISVIFKTLNIKIGESEEFQAKIAWSQIEDVPLLLGRLDIFDRFNINFRKNDHKVIFERDN